MGISRKTHLELNTHSNFTDKQSNNLKMSSTSQKHQAFISEPLEEKSVTECAGIGKVLGEKLKNAGFEYAYNLVGQFLLFNKDVDTMQEWLKEVTGANKKQSGDCARCIQERTEAFINYRH